MDQQIQHNDIDGSTVVLLPETHILEEMYGELLAVVESQSRDQVVLDLSSMRSISAAGLGRLLALKRQLRARGAKLILRNVGEQVYQAFVVTRLARYFGI
jgi:anti-anti-sigma factor